MTCKAPGCTRKAVRWYGWSHKRTFLKAPFCADCAALIRWHGKKLVPLSECK